MQGRAIAITGKASSTLTDHCFEACNTIAKFLSEKVMRRYVTAFIDIVLRMNFGVLRFGSAKKFECYCW